MSEPMRRSLVLAAMISAAALTGFRGVANAQGPPATMPHLPPSPLALEGHMAGAVLTLSVPKQRVDALLGPVRSTWTINCLQREMVTYTDGTRAIFVNNLLISANPAGMSLDALTLGHLMARQNGLIFFEPCVLCGAAPVGPMAETKRQVEESFWIGPPSHVLPPPYASFVPAFDPHAPIFPRLHFLFHHARCTAP